MIMCVPPEGSDAKDPGRCDMDKRPGWDEYFMNMAVLTAQRSTCLRRQVGAVIVRTSI